MKTRSLRPGKTLACLLACVLALTLMLEGCAPKRYPQGTGKPYTVRGKTYRPYTTAHGFTEVGVASWYGPGFHGKLTSNGERYNQNAMTAAHKLLPFNTMLRVTNTGNGRSIVVRINDRGPFVANRVIDLSRKGAEQIGMIGPGTARVRLEALEGQRVLTPEGDMLGRFYVQIGAFSVADNARRLERKMQNDGWQTKVFFNPNTRLNYVRVGPYTSVDQADGVLALLKPAYEGLFVVAE